jgi:hypothetical protein
MSLSSRSHAISVAIMVWNGEHHAFVTETYLKNGDSTTATQQFPHRHFGVVDMERFPTENPYCCGLEISETSSALQQKSSGKHRSIRTPENIAAV